MAHLMMRGVLRRCLDKQKTPHALRGLNLGWGWRADLNGRPVDYESTALPLSYASASVAVKVYHAMRPARNGRQRPDLRGGHQLTGKFWAGSR